MCHLDYGDFAVDTGNKIYIDKLNTLQNRSLRCVEYCLDTTRRKTIEELYHKFNVESLESRRKRNLLKIMYSESKDIVNIDVYRPQMMLRSSNSVKMHHKFTKLSKIQKSQYYRGLSLWDDLPLNIQKIETKKGFKSLIKKYQFE